MDYTPYDSVFHNDDRSVSSFIFQIFFVFLLFLFFYFHSSFLNFIYYQFTFILKSFIVQTSVESSHLDSHSVSVNSELDHCESSFCSKNENHDLFIDRANIHNFNNSIISQIESISCVTQLNNVGNLKSSVSNIRKISNHFEKFINFSFNTAFWIFWRPFTHRFTRFVIFLLWGPGKFFFFHFYSPFLSIIYSLFHRCIISSCFSCLRILLPFPNSIMFFKNNSSNIFK